MPNQSGFVDNTTQLAHYEMLDAIRTFALANGWVEMRYDNTSTDHEIILKGIGLTGLEEIYVGFRTYHSVGADYYNMVAMTCTGYVSGNSFDTQPGAQISGVPAHNQRIDYWLSLNAQRIILAMKVGTPVYESAYVGKFNPYARPTQFPYPVVCGGMLTGAATTRFSDTAQVMPYNGNVANMAMRDTNGIWQQVYCYPYSNGYLAGATAALRDTESNYHLMPVEIYTLNENLFGALDGVFFITGFDNTVENTVVIDTVTYVVIQDVYRTGFNDYYALRMDA